MAHKTKKLNCILNLKHDNYKTIKQNKKLNCTFISKHDSYKTMKHTKLKKQKMRMIVIFILMFILYYSSSRGEGRSLFTS